MYDVLFSTERGRFIKAVLLHELFKLQIHVSVPRPSLISDKQVFGIKNLSYIMNEQICRVVKNTDLLQSF